MIVTEYEKSSGFEEFKKEFKKYLNCIANLHTENCAVKYSNRPITYKTVSIVSSHIFQPAMHRLKPAQNKQHDL